MNAGKRQQKLDDSRRACLAGDAAAAERICRGLLRTNQADVQALHMPGLIAASQGDHAAALGHFGRCVAIAHVLLRLLGRLYDKTGDDGSAFQADEGFLQPLKQARA